LGFISALMGKTGIMSCTWAVESVVTEHLENQLVYLKSIGDHRAIDAVQAILEDEQHHRDIGKKEGGADAFLYIPLRWSVLFFTKSVIAFGMR